MGDKSPKSKERGQKQKTLATAQDAARAKSKQDGQSNVPLARAKGQK